MGETPANPPVHTVEGTLTAQSRHCFQYSPNSTEHPFNNPFTSQKQLVKFHFTSPPSTSVLLRMSRTPPNPPRTTPPPVPCAERAAPTADEAPLEVSAGVVLDALQAGAVQQDPSPMEVG